MNEAAYQEDQKFSQRWIRWIQWLVGAGAIIISCMVVIQKKASWPGAVVALLLISGFIAFFNSLKLELRITEDSIRYRFSPIQVRFRVILKSDIAGLEIRSYDALADYGGWGIRYGRKGIAYTVKGDSGIDILLRSNKHVLIGTCRPQEVEAFLRSMQYC